MGKPALPYLIQGDTMFDTKKLSRETLALLTSQLVDMVQSEVPLDEDESLELYDAFYEVLDDQLSSRG